ncbi:MAG: hypothetical protein ACE5KJ_04965 [Candidatus Zixiibacteriota bacterium]
MKEQGRKAYAQKLF